MKKFINTTAEKEMVGRQKLEEFISELIDRADQAERELKLMRRETRTSHLTKDPTADRVNSEHLPILFYTMTNLKSFSKA